MVSMETKRSAAQVKVFTTKKIIMFVLIEFAVDNANVINLRILIVFNKMCKNIHQFAFYFLTLSRKYARIFLTMKT